MTERYPVFGVRGKKAGSQAGWALVTGGVNDARVEAHRIHQLLGKCLKAVEASKHREELFALAGDILVDFPERVKRLEQSLDETSYALALLGQDFLKDHLSATSRARIDTTVESVGSLSRYSLQRILQSKRQP